MVKWSNENAAVQEIGGGCPVKHSSTDSTPSATAVPGEDNGKQPSSSAADASTGGRWFGVASWLPFRSGRDDSNANLPTVTSRIDRSDSGKVLGETLTSNAGGGATTSTEDVRGGCPVHSSSDTFEEPPSLTSGCPVQHDSSSSPTAAGTSGIGGVWDILTGGGDKGGGNRDDVSRPAAATPSAGATSPEYNALNNEYVYGQEVAAGQEVPLSTIRQRSSIPKAEHNPDHQPEREADRWVYPSEQQYYNAIKRKGYTASASDMPSTLAIHNAVNEKGWEMVREWERARVEAASFGAGDGTEEGSANGDTSAPKLLRFTGRPKDISPKAWIMSNLLGYRPPFDRHDWVVKRPDGTEARYVIDFYAGKPPPGSNMPVAMHLDVRPALDSVDAAVDRGRMFYKKDVRPYLSSVLDAFKNDPGPPPSDQDAPPSAAR